MTQAQDAQVRREVRYDRRVRQRTVRGGGAAYGVRTQAQDDGDVARAVGHPLTRGPVRPAGCPRRS